MVAGTGPQEISTRNRVDINRKLQIGKSGLAL